MTDRGAVPGSGMAESAAGDEAARLSRRRLLGAAAAATMAGAGVRMLTDGAPGADAAAAKPSGKRVVVLGGGLAGLCAAYELRNKGYKVVAVLEAQQRTGGRVQTVRQGFVNGQYAELGATRIASSHNFTLGYASQFGLPLVEFTSGDGLYQLKGRAPFVHTDGTAWPADILPGLQSADRLLGADAISWKYDRGDIITDPGNPGYLGDPNSTRWPFDNALAANLIPVSYRQYWANNGASNDAFLLNRAINGSEIHSDGALYWLMADIVDATWSQTFAIRGGNDRLPAAFTSSLGALVKYGCAVTAIRQNADGATVSFVEKGRTSTVDADFVVCGLPFSILRSIDISPQLPADKTATIQNLRYMPVGRNFMQTRSRFWTQRGIGGLKIARTDTGIDRLWHNTDVQDGATSIVGAYMQNQTGVDYAAAGSNFAQRTAYVKGIVSTFFPEIGAEYLGGVEKIWQNDPYVKGAWGWFAAGEQWMFPVAKRPEGRVHFCGEHTSAWSGWMQGAFESANRVVSEINS